ncbi:MAG: S8 family serine peptidase [Kiritimatiellae bacterium]|nr:S8 family serine peptidase [Kiritimatiellia bacterium]
MKNILKWFSILSLSATAAFAAEPLLLQWGSIDTSGSEAQAESTALKAKVAKKAALARARKSAAAAGERAAYVVQFAGPVSEAQRTWLEASTQVRGYLPENAYIVWATAAEMESIAASSDVFWTGEWKKEYKTVRTAAAKRAAAASDEARWMQVGSLLAGDEGAADLRARLEALPATVRSAFPRLDGVSAVAYLTDAQVDEVASWADVDWIEPKLKPILLNDKAALTNMMNVTPAWKAISSGGLGLTGAGQVVAVADTGCDKGSTSDIHADFSGRIKAGYGWTNGAYKSSASWADYDAHGTHVCGSVLGSGAQSSGQFRGIAYEAQLVMQGCWEDLDGLPDNAQDLFKQAYSQGARIHSDSWGFDTNLAAQYVYDAVYADGYMWTNQNFLALFAAGNDGIDKNKDGVIDPGSVTPPSTAKNCLCVGAAENYRSSGGYSSYTWGGAWGSDYPTDPIKSDKISGTTTPQGLAAFSSRGPTEDGRFKPDIVAPGTDIISVRSRVAQDDGWGEYNTHYLYEGGTSMATPLTSGATTLVRQWLVDRQGIAEPMAALMKALLINGARDMTPGQYGTGSTQEITARPDRSQGFGHVNLYNALEPGDGNFLVFATNKFTTTGANYTTNIAVGQANAGKYILTLAWQDYPGTSGASKTLVNDLDLTVTSPSGTVYYPNNYGTLDHTNNVEFIEFTASEVGSYTVKVNAYKISKTTGVGSQPFALVMRGPETVLEPASPEFTSATSATEGVQNSDIEFTFSDILSAGYPAPTYTITTAVSSDEYDFDGDTGYLYFQPANAGTFTFTCVASNEHGSATNTLTVTVTLAQPPAPPEPTVVASDSFTAIWTAVSGATGYELVVVEGAAGGSGTTLVETFANAAFTPGGGSYADQTISGGDLGTWTATQARGDKSTPVFRYGGTLTSPSFDGGVSSVEFDYEWPFSESGDCDIELYVNGTSQGTATVTGGTAGTATYALATPVAGSSTIEFRNKATSNKRIQVTEVRIATAGRSVHTLAIPRAAGDVVFSNGVGNVTSYQVTGLQPNTTYSYSYRAIVDGQATPWSESTAVTTSEGDAAPVWSELPAQTVNVGADTSIQLADYVAGSPTPAITLDSSTAAAADYEFEDGLLVFQPSAPGTYTFTFTASNSVGTSTAALTVTAVAEAPVLSASLGTSVAAVVGDDVEFTVTATGIPAPTVTMAATEHDAVFIDGAFAFAPTSVGTYTFTFTASNVAGSDTLTVTVTVTAAPVTVPEFLVENVTDTTAHARWTECTGVASYTLQLASDDQFTTGGSGGEVTLFSNDGTDASAAPDGWTYNIHNTSGSYLQLMSGNYVVSEAFDASACTDLSLSLYMRTYGGTGQPSVTVEYSTDGGTTWSEPLGTLSAANSTMAERTLDVSDAAGASSVRLRIASTSTSSSVGVGIKTIVLTGTEASGSGSLISTTTVNGTDYTFTGLAPETTYFARVKGDAGWSNVEQFTTEPETVTETAPAWSASFPASGTVNVGELYELAAIASYVTGSPPPVITFTGPDGVLAEIDNGNFQFIPEASGDYTFTFTAANGISPDATATLVVTAVGQAPVLTASQGTTVDAVVGDTVEFTVTATGIPVPTVAMAATEYDAIFENGEFLFVPDAVGTYAFTFTAENTEGTDTLTVTVTVSPPPVTIPELTVTDITDTTALATWTACDGVASYTLQLSTNDFAAASGASVRSATPILSEDFAGFTASGSTDISASLDSYTATAGWTGTKVYCNSGEAKIGSSSGQPWIITPALAASGTLRVVWTARRYGTSDHENLLLGISENGTDFVDETIPLADDMTTYTNEFALAGSTAYVRWMGSGSSKARFYLDDVTITNPGGGDTPAGDDVQEFTVPGTSYEFTGLTPYTVYYARVKGNAAWSDTEEFITEEAPAPGIAPAWSADFPATATIAAGEDYEFPNVSSYATGTPSPTIELTAADSADCAFDSESDYFRFNTATPGTYTFTFTASNVLGIADAILTVTVTATPSDFEQWLADHAASGHAAGETAPNGRTYWDNYIADIDPGDTYLAIEIADPSAGTFTIPAASPNRTYTLLWTTNLATGDYQQQDLGPGAPSTSIPFPTPADWYGGLQVTLPSDP